MKRTMCMIICSLFLFSIYACATSNDKKSSLHPKLLEVSKDLGIDNPEAYWTIDWKEIDKDKDNYLSRGEVAEAYPEYGLDAFPYFDTNNDGKISWDEHAGLIDYTERQ